jgi:hypothetical protein
MLAHQAAWRVLGEVGALGRLRTLSLLVHTPDRSNVIGLLRSPLGAQLEHLDLHVNVNNTDHTALLHAFRESAVDRLVLRYTGGDAKYAISIERDQLVVAIDGALGASHYDTLALVIDAVRSGTRRIRIARDHGIVQAAFVFRMRELFEEVENDAALPAWWTL